MPSVVLSTNEHGKRSSTQGATKKPQGVLAAKWKAFKKNGHLKQVKSSERSIMTDANALFYFKR